jgi:hypothetical protein
LAGELGAERRASGRGLEAGREERPTHGLPGPSLSMSAPSSEDSVVSRVCQGATSEGARGRPCRLRAGMSARSRSVSRGGSAQRAPG